MTIFEAIREDHDIQRDLLNKLVAEERHFYKPLISNDMMQDHARHGIAEHHEIDELIEQLEDTERDASSWLKIAKDLKHKVEHHLEDEEHSFFQLAGKVFSDNQKETLAASYQSYMKKNL